MYLSTEMQEKNLWKQLTPQNESLLFLLNSHRMFSVKLKIHSNPSIFIKFFVDFDVCLAHHLVEISICD